MSIREAAFPKGSPRRLRVSTQIGGPLASKPERFDHSEPLRFDPADSDAIGCDRTRSARQCVRRARIREALHLNLLQHDEVES
jgi:hypothetical protein